MIYSLALVMAFFARSAVLFDKVASAPLTMIKRPASFRYEEVVEAVAGSSQHALAAKESPS